jgi:hypothetical protein
MDILIIVLEGVEKWNNRTKYISNGTIIAVPILYSNW